MTDTHNRVRAVVLAILMIVSVFGGTIAFAGHTAAATGTVSANSNYVSISGGASFDISDTDNPNPATVVFLSGTETVTQTTETFSGDGSTTTFSVSATPIVDTNLDGTIAGDEVTATVSGSPATVSSVDPITGDVTLQSAPASGTDNVDITFDSADESTTVDASSGSATASYSLGTGTASAGDNTLQTADGETITAAYWDSSEGVYRSATQTVDDAAPSINNIALTDQPDSDGIVGDGDTVKVTADITDSGSGVSTVTVDGSNFGAGGSVTMVDDGSGADSTGGDGTYTGTFIVDTASAGSGDQGADVTGTDAVSNSKQVTSPSAEDLAVDINANAPSVESIIEYNSGDIEIAFSEGVFSAKDGSSLPKSNFTVYIDGSDKTDTFSYAAGDADDGRVTLTRSNDIPPSSEVKVKISNVTDAAQSDYVTPGNVSVDLTSRTITQSTGSGSFSGSDSDAYAGEVIAFDFGGTETFEINTEDEFVFEGSTGTNSHLYVFDTEERNTSAVYEVDDGSAQYYLGLRALGLGISVGSTSVQTDESLDVAATANAGNRPVEYRILDSSGDEFYTTSSQNLNGSGGNTYSFPTSTFTDADTANYTIEVSDLDTGATAESSSVQVTEAGTGAGDFGQSTYTDQRGDVVNITVEVEETSTATVTIGSDSAGFLSNVTVEDNNGDGEVLLQFNTWAADQNSFPSDGGNVFNAFNADDVSSGDQDAITAADVDANRGNDVGDLLDSGNYDLGVRAGSDSTASEQNVATLVIEERSTGDLVSWTAPSGEAPADLDELQEMIGTENVTQSSEIANGDVVVHQLTASGLEGALEEQLAGSASNTSEAFYALEGNTDSAFVDLTVNQSEAGSNRDAYGLVLNATNTDVIADSDNNTYYIVFDTDDPVPVRQSGTDYAYSGGSFSGPPTTVEDDNVLRANFTIYEDKGYLADSDQTVATDYELVNGDVSTDADPVNVSNAEGQTVTGTATVAPGTEVTVRISSDDGVQPSFLKTTDVSVQADGSWSATFDFSGQSVGDSFTIESSGGDGVIASDDQLDVDGNVVESTGMTTTEPADTTTSAPDTTTSAPDTTTEAPGTTAEPGTETPTSTPGFGVVVALTALIAAALLALRREN
jgi:PGF-CTERM protein/surface glycoprotein (TIGR04207 family)